MDRSEQWTNVPTYGYSFPFSVRPYKFNPNKLKKFYFDEHLSVSQIAEKLGVSHTWVVSRLHRMGIRNEKGRLTNPQNYRHHTPPIGYKLHEGKLVLNRGEIKICRLVVRLVRDGVSYNGAADELMFKGIKNRKDKVSWGHQTIANIYRSWKEKL